MKTGSWVLTSVLFFSILAFQGAFAKGSTNPENNSQENPSGLYVGGQATTNGLGLNLHYIISKRLTLGMGVEAFNLSRNFTFDENDISYDTELNYKTGGLFLLADYFYTRSLYLSAGAVLNNFQPRLEGMAVSDMEYGDISIPASQVGGFDFQFEPDLKVSPYAALGFRRFIGKKQMVTYNFETGLYYMGPPRLNIEANGLLAPTADPAHGKKEQLEEQFSAYKFYPVVKFAIALRLF